MAPGSRTLAWGRLLRLSLAPSAPADVAAGCVLAPGSWPSGPGPFVLMLASSCVYHGGMALNDWADRGADARTRPARPIPSGLIGAAAALRLAVGLLALGPLLAFLAAPRCALALGAVALCAALYDLAGRGPWRGPLLLALCRAGNMGAGLTLSSTQAPWRWELLLAPSVYGTYVFLVSRLARLEDLDQAAIPAGERRPLPWAFSAQFALFAHGLLASVFAARALPGLLRSLAPMGLAVTGAFGLRRALLPLSERAWTSAEIQSVAGMALRRLLICSATLACGAGSRDGYLVAGLILCGYPLAFALRRVFPPT